MTAWGLPPAAELDVVAAERRQLERMRRVHLRAVEAAGDAAVERLGDPVALLRESWHRLALRLVERELAG